MVNEKYSAGLTSQSFWFVEFKKIAYLLYSGKTEDEIKNLCLNENLFGTAKENRAKRMYGYIMNRINQLDNRLLKIFVESDLYTQKLINLLCILKSNRLFFEFIYEVYREKAILGFDKIEDADISVFFNGKEIQNEDIAKWTDSTKKRLHNIYTNYMVDANLLTIDNKEKKITIPILDIVLERYLEANGEEIMIKALTGVR